MTELETERLRLRLWRDDDLPHLERLSADETFMRYLGPRAPAEDQVARYRRQWAEHGFGIWAVEERESGRFVGRIGLQFHSLWPEDPEVGWSLDPGVWGRGYATEGGAAAVRHAFEALGFERVVSIVHPENAPSIRVMDRLGLQRWREVWWEYGRTMLDVRTIERERWARLQSSG